MRTRSNRPFSERRTMEQTTELDQVTGGRTRSGSNSTNVVSIGPRDTLSGTLTVDGDVGIAGRVEGEIDASGDIDVEATAQLRTSLDGGNVTVRGKVTGDLHAH